jgi:molybdate transport system substrate-binding protein
VKRLAALVAALAVVAAGCSSSGVPSAGDSSGHSGLSGSITVFAAASLTDSFNALGTQFQNAHPGTKIVFNLGGSSALATQIDEGAPGDVFASAATKNMTDVTKAGNADNPVTFVKNSMQIAAAPGNPAHIATVADLARPGVKVALCEATVPCGVVAAEVFAKAGVTVKPTASAPDVKSALAVVESGEVDAGVVYLTDVKAAGDKVVGVPIPDAQDASTDYPIATLKHSKNAALAKAFVAYVLSTDGQQVLAAAGFRSP